MKALILALACIPCYVNGQGWLPDEAVWHYGYSSGFGQQGYVRMEVAGDTVVNGLAGRKLIRTRETYDFISQQYGSETMPLVIMHEAAGVVWVYVPSATEFDTLYHMAAVPGDQWSLPPMPDPVLCSIQSRMVVADTGAVMMDGVPLRWLAVDIHYVDSEGGITVVEDTITERVGTNTYLLPHDYCNGWVDGQEGGPLRCYQDAEISYFASGDPCDLILGSEPLASAGIGVQAYPNPSNGQFTISTSTFQQVNHLEVRNIIGRLVLTRSLARAAGPMNMDLSNEPAGLYLVHLHLVDGSRAVGQVVKE